MVSRLLIGDNNLSRFWNAYQFARPGMKNSSLLTATDLDTFDHALTQADDKEVVIISVFTIVVIVVDTIIIFVIIIIIINILITFSVGYL